MWAPIRGRIARAYASTRRHLAMSSSADCAASCSASFLERPTPGADLLAADRGLDGEGPVVRRPLLVDNLVADQLAAPRQALLERRLVVHRVLQRVLDLRPERIHHHLGRCVVAEGQVAGADHRLDHRRQDALGRDERLEPRRRCLRRRRAQPLRHAQALGHRPAGAARHRLRADLGQASRPEALGVQAGEQVRRDRQPQDAVAQEGEALVGLRATHRPRRVGEHGPLQVGLQPVEHLRQGRARPRVGRAGPDPWRGVRVRALLLWCHSVSVDWPAVAGRAPLASTKSTAWPTVRIRLASSSEIRTP